MNHMVGQIYPEYIMSDRVIIGYGSGGFRLVYIMDTPTHDEIVALSSRNKFTIRMGVIGEHIVFCIKPGNQPWSDCMFAPGLQPDLPYNVEVEEGKGFLMTLELYDGRTGELKHLRAIGLSHEFSLQFLKGCREILAHKAGRDAIMDSLNNIISRPTRDLVDICDCRCVTGG